MVFFIDDDSELAADAVSTVVKYFSNFSWLKGMAPPLIDKRPRIDKYIKHPVIGMLRDLIYAFFMGKEYPHRKIRNSARNSFPAHDTPGVAEWLTGAGMAFRKIVFESMEFDERLELFGGYALGEDYDFSHRVFLHYNEPLLVASSDPVIHHNADGGRIGDNVKRCACIFYNTSIIRTNFRKYRSYRLLPFIWESRFGMILSLLMQRVSATEIFRGYVLYRKALASRGGGKKD